MRYKHNFVAEIDPKKRKFLHETLSDASTCGFTNATHCDKESAPCFRHGARADPKEEPAACPLRGASAIFMGSSCKYFSRANKDKSHGDPKTLLARAAAGVSSSAGPPHQSLATYLALMSHARAHKPDIIVLENTDSIADDPSTGEALQSEHDAAKSNVEQCILDFEEAGYEAQPFLLVSTDYGVPQKRRRFFVVALRSNSVLWTIDDRLGYDAVFNWFLQRMQEVEMAPPQLSSVLLQDDHPYVKGELQRRQALPRQPSGVGASWQADARFFFARSTTCDGVPSLCLKGFKRMLGTRLCRSEISPSCSSLAPFMAKDVW